VKSVECEETLSTAQKENIPGSNDETPVPEQIHQFDLSHNCQTPACPVISVS